MLRDKVFRKSKSVPIFSVLDLSPALWLDASDESTITESAGAVSQWDDKSGNGNNATQGTGSLQPITGTRTQNGENVIDFAGDQMNVPSGVYSTIAGDHTVFIVFAVDSAVQSFVLVGQELSSTKYYVLSSDTGPKHLIFDGGSLSTYTNTNVPDDTDFHHYTFVKDDTATSLAAYADGLLTRGVTGNVPVTVDALYIGWPGINAAIAEVIILDYVADADTRPRVEAYLANKWGIV